MRAFARPSLRLRGRWYYFCVGLPMADITLTVRLSFGSGELHVQSVRVAGPVTPSEARQGAPSAPYALLTFTAPLDPTLVQSEEFARIE